MLLRGKLLACCVWGGRWYLPADVHCCQQWVDVLRNWRHQSFTIHSPESCWFRVLFSSELQVAWCAVGSPIACHTTRHMQPAVLLLFCPSFERTRVAPLLQHFALSAHDPWCALLACTGLFPFHSVCGGNSFLWLLIAGAQCCLGVIFIAAACLDCACL